MASEPDKSKQPSQTRDEQTSLFGRLRRLFTRDIWEYGVGDDPSLKGQWLAILRILSVSGNGLMANRIFSRAAALSYSTLLALGPLIAVVVMLSSSLIKTDAETQIKNALLFIAPSLQELAKPDAEDQSTEEAEISSALDTLITQIVDGAQDLVGRINTSGSKAFGLFSAFIFIWVIIQLLTSVETTLNQIWGVHQGRPWSQRIVFYWTFISLGTLLGLGSTALLSAGNVADTLNWVPFGSNVASLLFRFSPVVSFIMLVLLLVVFYRFFPNTSVAFKPALIGSLLTAVLLLVNNYLSILYVNRVLSIQSLYGSVGIIPVMMIGLYFFWILILLGGQLTYAVQNVSLLANQAAWRRISPAVREAVTLAVFLTIARRFHTCERAPTAVELSQNLHVPSNILNESLEVLEELDWIARIRIEEQEDDLELTGFRPAKPLASYSLSRFRHSLEHLGRSEILHTLEKADPLLLEYGKAVRWHESDPFLQTDLQSLLNGD